MEKKATTPAPKAAAAPKNQSKGGVLNPAWVIPVLFAIALVIYIYVLGAPEHFIDGDHEKGPKPGDYYGIVYKGGPIVPILMTCFLIVLVYTIERLITLSKASGTSDVNAFVRRVRNLLDKNQIDEAIRECDKQKGSVGNVIRTGLEKYKMLTTDTTLDKEQKNGGPIKRDRRSHDA